jgi:hypothetical protein
MNIDELHKKTLKLEQQLEEEMAVKKSEVLMNKDLKDYNKKLEIQIGELVSINEKFLNRIIKLESIIDVLKK